MYGFHFFRTYNFFLCVKLSFTGKQKLLFVVLEVQVKDWGGRRQYNITMQAKLPAKAG